MVPAEFFSNLSANSSEDTITNQARKPLWVMTFLILLIITTIIANLLVIISFIYDRRLLKEPFNIYLLNLGISDFLAGALGMTNLAAMTYYGYWPYSYSRCTMWTYFDYLTTSESLLGVTVTAMDRLWAVSLPVSYRKHNTPRKAVVAVVMTWLFANAMIVPGLAHYRANISWNNSRYECSWDVNAEPMWASSYYAILWTEWVPTCVAALCYILTSIIFWRVTVKRNRQVTSSSAGIVQNAVAKQIQDRRYKKEKQVFILLSLLFGALIIMWMPCYTSQIFQFYYGEDDDLLLNVSLWMSYSLSAVNPFLFNIGNQDMRKALRRMLLAKRVGDWTRTSWSRNSANSRPPGK